jgi:3-oxoacyl-[acyl-carrier-protein] synthase-1
MGSGGPSARTIVEAADTTRTKGPKRVGPFAVPKAMSSTASRRSPPGSRSRA